MNKLNKKINLLFLILVLLGIEASVLVSALYSASNEISVAGSLILSESIIILPGIIFCFINFDEVKQFLIFKKLSLRTIGLTVLFTALVMPISGIANMVSLFFTTNTVTEVSNELYDMPYWLMLFIIGIFGPFCEEFVYRGIVFQGFKQSGRRLSAAIISALFFGLMHMNLNQFCYSFVLGFIFAILIEATGTMLGSFIGHATVNCYNVILMIISRQSGDVTSEEISGALSASEIVPMLMFYVFLSCITIPLAIRVLYKICGIENTELNVKLLRKNENPIRGNSVVTISGGIALAICLFVIFALEVVI